MCITRHSLGHRLLCMVRLYELHLEKWQCYCCIMAVSIVSARTGENIVFLLPWPLHQLRENAVTAAVPARRKVVLVRLWYGRCSSCCTSQETINGSAVPMAPQVFFQPLSLFLVHPGFNKQCEQQENWHCEQDQ